MAAPMTTSTDQWARAQNTTHPSRAAHPSRSTASRPHGRSSGSGRASGPAAPPYARRRAAVLLTAAAVAVGVFGLATPALQADPVDPAAGATVHVVGPGDTLWAIASAAAPSSDPRVVIDDILTVHERLGDPLHPGQLRSGQRVVVPPQ